MAVFNRYQGRIRIKFKSEATQDEILLETAKTLWKKGVIKISTVYDEGLNTEIITSDSQIWWDEDITNKKEPKDATINENIEDYAEISTEEKKKKDMSGFISWVNKIFNKTV